MPAGKAEVVLSRLDETPATDLASLSYYIVKKGGDTLPLIARKLHVNKDDLAEANYLKATSRVSAGQKLIVPAEASALLTARADRAVPATEARRTVASRVNSLVRRRTRTAPRPSTRSSVVIRWRRSPRSSTRPWRPSKTWNPRISPAIGSRPASGSPFTGSPTSQRPSFFSLRRWSFPRAQVPARDAQAPPSHRRHQRPRYRRGHSRTHSQGARRLDRHDWRSPRSVVRRHTTAVFSSPASPAGRYTLSAWKSGYAIATCGAPSFWAPASVIALDAGHSAEGFEIALAKGAAISGRVVDDAGEPLTDMQSERRPGGAGQRPRRVSGVRAAEKPPTTAGEYRIGGLPPGSYVVSVFGRARSSRVDAPAATPSPGCAARSIHRRRSSPRRGRSLCAPARRDRLD